MTPISKKEFYIWMMLISIIFMSLEGDLYSDLTVGWREVLTFAVIIFMLVIAFTRYNRARRYE